MHILAFYNLTKLLKDEKKRLFTITFYRYFAAGLGGRQPVEENTGPRKFFRSPIACTSWRRFHDGRLLDLGSCGNKR